jgi:hypothetical protein
MNNAETYNFEDFTYDHYKHLLAITQKKWNFISYPEYFAGASGMLWRHDVDFSPWAALKIAQIEHEMGVRSNFFFLVHSEFYNILEHTHTSILREISNMGHYIGLHYDASYYQPQNKFELEKTLGIDKKILETLLGFDVKIDTFSFHIPTDYTLSLDERYYCEMINTYANEFQKSVPYCSDSNGYWRHMRMEVFLKEVISPTVQCLTHPAWWSSVVKSPKEKLDYVLAKQVDHTRNKWLTMLEECGRCIPDW